MWYKFLIYKFSSSPIKINVTFVPETSAIYRRSIRLISRRIERVGQSELIQTNSTDHGRRRTFHELNSQVFWFVSWKVRRLAFGHGRPFISIPCKNSFRWLSSSSRCTSLPRRPTLSAKLMMWLHSFSLRKSGISNQKKTKAKCRVNSF